MPSNGRIVFSTDQGRICPECSKPVGDCSCKNEQPIPPSDGVVHVSLGTKGRRGKQVTVISGVPLGTDDLKALAKTLKARCGTGGTSKDGEIQIQGDHRDVLCTELRERGYRVKKR